MYQITQINTKDKTNVVDFVGELSGYFNFNHEDHGEKFYLGSIGIQRLSLAYDTIPVMVPEILLDEDLFDKQVHISGQLRTYNMKTDERTRLILYVFVSEIELCEDEDTNYIYLDGTICKEPIYRTTPGGREICDVLLAVNRAYGKSDYIPCVFWGRNAKLASRYCIGDNLALVGRIQSREYCKKYEDGTFDMKVAYEVSASRIEH